MPILDLLIKSPYSCLALLLYLGTIVSAMRLVSKRHYGPDRLLLALLGLVSTYQGAHILQEAGVWVPPVDARAYTLANLAVAGLCLMAVWVVARWSREHLATKRELRLVEAAAPAQDESFAWGPASPELMAAALQALPISIRLTDNRGKCLFDNNVQVSEENEAIWSVPVGNGAVGCQLAVRGLTHSGQTPLPVPVPSPVRPKKSADDPTQDRRRQLRLRLTQPLPVEVQAIDGSDWKTIGTIIDFSGGGLCVELAQAAPVGGALLIVMEDALVLGEVCYCRPYDEMYRIGLRSGQFLMNGDRAGQNANAALVVTPLPGVLEARQRNSQPLTFA